MPRQFDVPEEVIQDVVMRKRKPDAYSEYLTGIHSEHVIGVNNAYQIGDWIDIVFFGDCAWYLVHRFALERWPGLKVTCCSRFENKLEKNSGGIKYLRRDTNRRHGISNNSSQVSWNGNSGAAAINLAVHLGVKRIILLGFDMCLDEKQVSHWHGSHGKSNEKKRPPPFAKHMRGFPAIAEDAKQMGIEVLLVGPSAIEVFPKVSLKNII